MKRAPGKTLEDYISYGKENYAGNMLYIQSDNQIIMINLVNIGYGVGFSLAGYIDRSAHIENLRIFSVVNPPVTATFYAVYKKGKHLTKAALSLIDMVKMSVNEQFPFI